jgi:hypothetical protein
VLAPEVELRLVIDELRVLPRLTGFGLLDPFDKIPFTFSLSPFLKVRREGLPAFELIDELRLLALLLFFDRLGLEVEGPAFAFSCSFLSILNCQK